MTPRGSRSGAGFFRTAASRATARCHARAATTRHAPLPMTVVVPRVGSASTTPGRNVPTLINRGVWRRRSSGTAAPRRSSPGRGAAAEPTRDGDDARCGSELVTGDARLLRGSFVRRSGAQPRRDDVARALASYVRTIRSGQLALSTGSAAATRGANADGAAGTALSSLDRAAVDRVTPGRI